MDIVPRKLYPAGLMARSLGVPVSWLKREAEAGLIPCVKADKAMLFDPHVVERLLLDRAQKPCTEPARG